MVKAVAAGAARLASERFRPDARFNGVKVFSATMMNDRAKLGETVTRLDRVAPYVLDR